MEFYVNAIKQKKIKLEYFSSPSREVNVNGKKYIDGYEKNASM